MAAIFTGKGQEYVGQRATVVIRREDKFLLVREVDVKWLLPGGKIGRNELPMVAALRELHEETQLVATSIAFLFTHGRKSDLHHVFEAWIDRTHEPVASQEIAECAWFSAKELEAINASSATRKIISALLPAADPGTAESPRQG
jgi:8-oxo-dGTP diphosphatase